MKVIYLACEPRIDSSKSVGHVTHIKKTIKGLQKKGHNVFKIIAGERQGAQKAKSTFGKVKTRLPFALKIMLRDLYAIAHDREFFKHCRSVCREGRFDFIYERATPYHRTGQRLAGILKVPHILEVNSPLEEMITYYGCNKIMIPLASYIEKHLALKAHAIVVGSVAMGRYLAEKGVMTDKIFTVYPTADDDAFKPTHYRTDIRQQLGVDDKTVVGFVGSMRAFHKVDLLLRAAIEVNRVSSDINFLIVGDGVQMSFLKRFVRENALEGIVIFTGRVPFESVPEYCGAMDICVIPHATWYGSPTKLFEYAAAGKAIIAPRIGPIQELITDGENGMLTEVGQIKDLKNKILTLAGNPTLRQRLATEFKQKILHDYTWDKNTDKLISIFESIRTRM